MVVAEGPQRLAHILEQGGVGVGQLDRELRFVAVNEALARMNGIAVEDHVGRTPMELLPDVPDETVEALRWVLATGQAIPAHEFVLETPAMPGVRRVWLESYHPVHDEGGAVVGVGLVALEITRRVANEERIRWLHELGKALGAATSVPDVVATIVDQAVETLAAATGALWLRDGDRLVLRGSRGDGGELDDVRSVTLDRDLGIVHVARTGIPIFASSPEAIRRGWPHLAEVLARSDTRSLVVVPVVGREGIEGVLMLTYREQRFLDDADRTWAGSLGQLCGQAVERARLFETERSVRGSLQHILERMPVPVAVVDRDGTISVANQRVSELFGRPIVPGMPLDEFVALPRLRPDGTPYGAGEVPVARALGSGEVIADEEFLIVRPDGARRWVLASSAPLAGEDGRVTSAVMTYTDITDQREAEGIRDAFIGVLSHELRTPITSVYAGTQILLRARVLGEREKAILGDTAAEAERLLRLVEDLLVVARAERNAVTGEREPLLVQRILPRIVAEEERRTPSCTFAVSVPAGLPVVVGDETYVGQVLRNLISNAAKYGGGTVDVEAALEGREVVVRVLDRGPGIAPDDLGHVFELFFRTRGATRVAPGAGIGLFVARQLAEAMDGRLWADRRDGGGSVFALALSVHDEHEDRAGQTAL